MTRESSRIHRAQKDLEKLSYCAWLNASQLWEDMLLAESCPHQDGCPLRAYSILLVNICDTPGV